MITRSCERSGIDHGFHVEECYAKFITKITQGQR
jgi:hypothetical protein